MLPAVMLKPLLIAGAMLFIMAVEGLHLSQQDIEFLDKMPDGLTSLERIKLIKDYIKNEER